MSHATNPMQITPTEVVEAFRPETRTQQAKGVSYGWSDARSIREEHNLRPFWRQLYETRAGRSIDTEADAVRYPGVVPDCLIHLRRDERELLKQDEPDLSGYPEERRKVLEWLAVDDGLPNRGAALNHMKIGGTDFLGTGQPGSGKSTLGNDLARELLELNPTEAVVWRGTPNRAEWTPLARWTKLLLPAGVDATVTVQPPHHGAEPFELAVEDVARSVERYDDIFDLFDRFDPGQFHVVYPDPRFEGVADLFYESARTPNFRYVSPFSAEAAQPDVEPTPLNHWWFGFVIGMVDVMGPEWLSAIIDEIGDLLPQSARSGEANHFWYEKIEAFRDALVDARKNNKSVYLFGHNEADSHALVRRKLRWRITMPGWPNPTEGDSVVGFGTAPMKEQHTKFMTVGEGLWWTALNFSEFGWRDVAKPTSAKISVDFPQLGGASS